MNVKDMEKKIYDFFEIKQAFVSNCDAKGNEQNETEIDKMIAERKEKLVCSLKNQEGQVTEDQLKQIELTYKLIKDKKSREELHKKILRYKYSHKEHPGLVDLPDNIEMQNMEGSRVYARYGFRTVSRVGKLVYTEKSIAPDLVPEMDVELYIYRVNYTEKAESKTVTITTPEDLINPNEEKKDAIEKLLLSNELLEASQLPSNATYIGTVSEDNELSLEQKEMPINEQVAHQAVIEYQRIITKRGYEHKKDNPVELKYSHIPDYSPIKQNAKSENEMLMKMRIIKDENQESHDYGNGKIVKRLGVIQYSKENPVYVYNIQCIIDGQNSSFKIYTTEDLINFDSEKEKIINDDLLSEEMILASQNSYNNGFIGKILGNRKLSLTDKDFFGDDEEKKAFAIASLYARKIRQDKQDKEALDLVANKNENNFSDDSR